jgi:two-component sensor histidine kinase
MKSLMARSRRTVPGRDRFEVAGPCVWLSAKQALAVAMALQLWTSAAKYGALSNVHGHVRIGWFIAGLNGSPTLQMHWTEAGGPRVEAPSRSGFGSRLIERGLSHDLRGKAKLDFAASTGVRWVYDAPLERSGLR